RGPFLAAVQSPDPGGADLPNSEETASRPGQILSLRKTVLVVQSRGRRRLERDSQAVLRRGRRQGLRHPRHAAWVDRRAGAVARPISVSNFLGTDGGEENPKSEVRHPRLHGM